MGNAYIGQIIKMGADAPIPPNTMNAAAPDGALLRRFDYFFVKDSDE
jgi:uncharacterized membrane protein YagU involved in acid resistance